MAERTRVAIIGAGAMGCLFGAALRECGCEVTLVDRSARIVEAIVADGIWVEEGEIRRNVRGCAATTEYAAIRGAALVIVFVKSAFTKSAAASIAPHLAPESLVLTLQNGLGNIETLCSCLPERQVAAGVTGNGAVALGPGHIRPGGKGETVIGELDGSESPRLAFVREIFNAAGFPSRVSGNVTGVLWTKLMVNVGINPVSALGSLKNGEVPSDADAFSVASAAVREAAAVAAAANIRLDVGDPVAHMRHVAELTAPNESSMLQDLRAGRATEIEALNGEVERRGRALGVPTPVNAALAALIRLRQKRSGA